VIEEDPVAAEHIEALPVVHCGVEAIDLRYGVGASGSEAGKLVLRDLLDVSEHLAAGGLIELSVATEVLHSFEDPGDPEARDVSG